MPLVQTRGAASAQGFGEFAQAAPAINYIDDVFSTYLYTGTAPTDQTINNGIDLAGKGGMVWFKGRNTAAGGSAHIVVDTVRGRSSTVKTYTTNAAATSSAGVDLVSFNSNGFTVGSAEQVSLNNSAPTNYASWTFREQPKFFDVVTYTGNGVANRQISHSLGSTPGMVIVKCTNDADSWMVYHQSSGAQGNFLILNSSAAVDTRFPSFWGTTPFSSTTFSVSDFNEINGSGRTYVAYLFAHNAGGFGTAGTDNVISCGSFTTDGAGSATVSLGYEPQYLMFKSTGVAQNWFVVDNMRGFSYSSANPLYPNTSGAEADFGPNSVVPTATGFVINRALSPSETYIYMAIRRPMKPPTSGTQVFLPTKSNAATGTAITTNFVVDSQWINYLTGDATNTTFNDRLRGVSTTTTDSGIYLISSATAGEALSSTTRNWVNTGFQIPIFYGGADNTVYYSFRRATGFFDVVCYTGTGVATTVAHNLGVDPELIIVKRRNSTSDWTVWSTGLISTDYLLLNEPNPAYDYDGPAFWGSATRTSTTFSVGTVAQVNASGGTFVAYLFASVMGVSKVGTYTGNGSNQTINCGFAAGARFVLIKSKNTANWFVWDTARGIVSGNDPYLFLNTSGAEVTTNDSIDPDNSGFIVNQLSATNINTSGQTYIFLAIA